MDVTSHMTSCDQSECSMVCATFIPDRPHLLQMISCFFAGYVIYSSSFEEEEGFSSFRWFFILRASSSCHREKKLEICWEDKRQSDFDGNCFRLNDLDKIKGSWGRLGSTLKAGRFALHCESAATCDQCDQIGWFIGLWATL